MQRIGQEKTFRRKLNKDDNIHKGKTQQSDEYQTH